MPSPLHWGRPGWALLLAFPLLAAACTHTPRPEVLLRPAVSAALPGLPTVDHAWHASQLLTIETRGQRQQVPVELELGHDLLTVVALSPWGSRLMTLRYDGRRIDAQTTEQAAFLPPPPQVLTDVLLVNWPVTDWDLPRGWRLDQAGGERKLWDAGGRVVTEVRYPAHGEPGDVVLDNHAYAYRLIVHTLAGDAPIP